MKRPTISTFCVLCMLLSSCTGEMAPRLDPHNRDPFDPYLKLSRDDYRHMARAGEGAHLEGSGPEAHVATGPVSPPPIPEISQILAAPRPPQIGESKLVSIAVTDDVPLKDVLIELARLANVDIELDSGIEGGISFRAKDRPFNEVIDRIADLAGLRYTMKGGVLRVERDSPYVQNYTLDFLNIVRNSTSNINISTNVLSSSVGGTGGGAGGAGGGGGGGSSSSGGGLNTGSNTTVTAISDGDFWKSLEEGVRQVLNYAPARRISAPISLPSDPFGEPVAPAATTTTTTTQAAGGASTAKTTTAVSAPVPAAVPVAAASGAAASANGSFFIINRQAGVLTVSGTQRQQAMIRTFLDKIRANASAQVLIEAKIVEVDLNEQYQTGIDWTALSGNGLYGFHLNPTAGTLGFGTDNPQLDVGTFTLKQVDVGINLNSVVKLADKFGTTRTLESPRLHAINNQQAVLTFAQNFVYFEIKVDKQTTPTSTQPVTDVTVNSTAKTVPIGIILSMQPSIDIDNNEVTLNIRPTLSRLVSTVPDPGLAFLIASTTDPIAAAALAKLSNDVPVVEVRELDSILKLKSGQVIVIGGLMEQKGANTDSGLPGASDIPFLGYAFKSAARQNRNKELVIFIKATIVGSNGNAAPADKDVYEKFSRDPRPIAF